MTSIVVNWGEEKVKLTWIQDAQLPQQKLITSVHGFCFNKNKLLMVNLDDRGWDFPGGHIESNETAEDCFKREAMEEGYVEGECHLLGYIVVDHSCNPNWDETSYYPKTGYQVFYRMNIKRLNDFKGEYESFQRIFISPDEVGSYYNDWHKVYQEILDCALRMKVKE